MKCEQRTLDDIRAMGGNTIEDERRFATAARVSEINLALYRTFAQPFIKAMFPPAVAERMRQLQPTRVSYEAISDASPLAAPMSQLAKTAREHRRPVAADNPFLQAQEAMSKQIVSTLDACRDMQENLSERTFMAIYGSPLLQAAVGIDPSSSQPLRKSAKSSLHRELVQARIGELKSEIVKGGLHECVVRGLLYVGLARGRVDERAVEALRSIRLMDDRPASSIA